MSDVSGHTTRQTSAPVRERDYLERTIATVRNHRDADNCWPQWANIFADEIERLWEALEFQMDEAVARWHETCPHEEQSLATWLGLSGDEFAAYVTGGTPALLDALASRVSGSDSTEGER